MYNNSNSNRSTNENGNSSSYRNNLPQRVSNERRERNFQGYPKSGQQVNVCEVDGNFRHNDSDHWEGNYIDGDMERSTLYDGNANVWYIHSRVKW